MDYGTAKILSLIGLIFIGIQMATGALIGLILFMQFVLLGALATIGGDGAGILCFVILLMIPLLFLIVPIVNFILAFGIYNKIKLSALDARDKTKMIWVIVLSFLGGGGVVPGVMFIVILATWDEITRMPTQSYY